MQTLKENADKCECGSPAAYHCAMICLVYITRCASTPSAGDCMHACMQRFLLEELTTVPLVLHLEPGSDNLRS